MRVPIAFDSDTDLHPVSCEYRAAAEKKPIWFLLLLDSVTPRTDVHRQKTSIQLACHWLAPVMTMR